MNPYSPPYGGGWYPNSLNPHVYIPPSYHPHTTPHGYHASREHWQSYANHTKSGKYPNLHPALASDMTYVRYDVRKSPRDGILSSTFFQIYQHPVFMTPVAELRLISKAFPWSIDIRLPAGGIVTCDMVWDALYNALLLPIADSEWGLIAGDKSRREAIEQAAKSRQDREKDKDKRLKRIDWLGDTTLFKGLDKDEDYEKKRLLPGSPPCTETWVVRFGKP